MLLDLRPSTPRAGPGPLVSVIVTLFNYAAFLPECLDSVAKQHHRPLELIVVDDGSSDESIETARNWMTAHGDEFERCLLIQHGENYGLSQSRNTAFAACKSEYAFVLDADNAIYPRAIGRLLTALSTSEAGAAYSQLEMFGAVTKLGMADVWDVEYFKKGNFVDAMGLIAKSAWREVGGYTNMNYGWEDYEFWCKFIEHDITGVFVPEILCRYRVHGTSMTADIVAGQNLKLVRVIHEITALHPWLDLTLDLPWESGEPF